jgi:hypothetical protein
MTAHRLVVPSVACLIWLALGCGSSADTQDDAGDSSDASILLTDENNYSSTATLSIPSVETAPAADLSICWSEVTSDLECHEVLPESDLDNVALLRFLHLSEEGVEARLTSGQLAQSEVDGYLDYQTDHQSTCATLSQLTLFGTPVDVEQEYVESSDHTYLLLFAQGTTPGVGARSMIFVRPTASSSNTTVNAVSGCGLLDFSAELASAEPVQIPVEGPWLVDWRNVTRDAQGNPLPTTSIDSVLLGFYENLTVEQLEASIMDLELSATALWEVELAGGRTADLATATDRETGDLFPGFERTADGTWLLGLMCSTCQNPAPVLLSVLEPISGAD